MHVRHHCGQLTIQKVRSHSKVNVRLCEPNQYVKFLVAQSVSPINYHQIYKVLQIVKESLLEFIFAILTKKLLLLWTCIFCKQLSESWFWIQLIDIVFKPIVQSGYCVKFLPIVSKLTNLGSKLTLLDYHRLVFLVDVFHFTELETDGRLFSFQADF